jgi:hypothetical protein
LQRRNSVERLLSSRSRRAGTPPSTFLFLPIYLSNIPEPYGPVSFSHPPTLRRKRREKPPKPQTSDMAKGHGRMIHRVNSEGLQCRAVASNAAARQGGLYSLGVLSLSTPSLLKIRHVRCKKNRTPPQPSRARFAADYASSCRPRRTTATFLRRASANRVGRAAMLGSRQRQLSFGALDGLIALTVRNRKGRCAVA